MKELVLIVVLFSSALWGMNMEIEKAQEGATASSWETQKWEFVENALTDKERSETLGIISGELFDIRNKLQFLHQASPSPFSQKYNSIDKLLGTWLQEISKKFTSTSGDTDVFIQRYCQQELIIKSSVNEIITLLNQSLSPDNSLDDLLKSLSISD